MFILPQKCTVPTSEHNLFALRWTLTFCTIIPVRFVFFTVSLKICEYTLETFILMQSVFDKKEEPFDIIWKEAVKIQENLSTRYLITFSILTRDYV